MYLIKEKASCFTCIKTTLFLHQRSKGNKDHPEIATEPTESIFDSITNKIRERWFKSLFPTSISKQTSIYSYNRCYPLLFIAALNPRPPFHTCPLAFTTPFLQKSVLPQPALLLNTLLDPTSGNTLFNPTEFSHFPLSIVMFASNHHKLDFSSNPITLPFLATNLYILHSNTPFNTIPFLLPRGGCALPRTEKNNWKKFNPYVPKRDNFSIPRISSSLLKNSQLSTAERPPRLWPRSVRVVSQRFARQSKLSFQSPRLGGNSPPRISFVTRLTSSSVSPPPPLRRRSSRAVVADEGVSTGSNLGRSGSCWGWD